MARVHLPSELFDQVKSERISWLIRKNRPSYVTGNPIVFNEIHQTRSVQGVILRVLIFPNARKALDDIGYEKFIADYDQNFVYAAFAHHTYPVVAVEFSLV